MKHDSLHSRKLLLVRRCAPDGKPSGDPFVAVDDIGAGEDEVVIVTTGSAARETEGFRKAPVDAVIVGIIDSVAVAGQDAFVKSQGRS
jgi:microcompartment protein CcmK/EutM